MFCTHPDDTRVDNHTAQGSGTSAVSSTVAPTPSSPCPARGEYLKDWARFTETHFGPSHVLHRASVREQSNTEQAREQAREQALKKAMEQVRKEAREEAMFILASKLVYISHPQISALECTIGLLSCVTLECGQRDVGMFERLANEIARIFNVPFERNLKNFSLTFKNEHAKYCLDKLIGSKPNHPLHPLYTTAISHFLRTSQK